MRVRAILRATPLTNVGLALAGAGVLSTIALRPWTGRGLDGFGVRMLLLAAAAGAAFAFDDQAATTLAASPTSLPRRRLVRAFAATAGAATGVVVLTLVLRLWSGRPTHFPLSALALEGAALIAAGLAASAVSISRGGAGGSGGQAALAALATLTIALFVLAKLFPRWSMLVGPGDAGWTRARIGWSLLLAGALAVSAWLSRDPASRALRRN